MSQYQTEIRNVILEYLSQEFPDYTITEEIDKESYCFRVVSDQKSYFLRVMYSAIECSTSTDLTTLFEQYAVASTMRGLGDFPVVVTESGCIFGSP